MDIRYLYAFLIIAVLVFLYIGAFLLNKKTKKPDGCEDVTGCSSCSVTSCALNANKEEK